MALQLNPEPINTPVRPAAPKVASQAAPATSPVPVVLAIPHLRGAQQAIVARIEPADQAAPSEHETIAEPSPVDKTAPHTARRFVGVACQRVSSIDWLGVGRWMDRPKVSYSFAAVLLIAIVTTIVASPRGSKPTAKPRRSPAATTSPADTQETKGDHAHLADLPHVHKEATATGANESQARHVPTETIVKLPPTAEPHEQHALPPQQQSIGDSMTSPFPQRGDSRFPRTTESTTNRNGTTPFPPTRSAVIAPTRPGSESSERPNVARLEGRLNAPQFPR